MIYWTITITPTRFHGRGTSGVAQAPCFRQCSHAHGLTRSVDFATEGPLFSFCTRHHKLRTQSSCRQPTWRWDMRKWKVRLANSQQHLCVQKSRPLWPGPPPPSREHIPAGGAQAAPTPTPLSSMLLHTAPSCVQAWALASFRNSLRN